jgi:hypothetical protein
MIKDLVKIQIKNRFYRAKIYLRNKEKMRVYRRQLLLGNWFRLRMLKSVCSKMIPINI